MRSEVDGINPVIRGVHLLENAFDLTVKINHALDEIKTKEEVWDEIKKKEEV